MTQEFTIPINIRISIEVAGVPISDNLGLGAVGAEGPKPLPSVDLNKFSLASLAEPSFTWRKALSLALASKVAYASESLIEDTGLSQWGLKTCRFIEADDTQCFVGSSEQAILVAFRGTENLGDWMSNLNLVSTSREYRNSRVRIHRGFLGAFQVVQRQIEESFAQLGPKPVLLTGHSLGGALALIACAEWSSRFNVACVQTFGQPAVGKADFAAFINQTHGSNYHRFVNDDDVVPRVPPWFKHCGSLIHYNKQGGLEGLASAAEAVGGFSPSDQMNDTPVISEAQFDLMRANLLQEKVARGGAPLGDQAVEHAAEVAGIKPIKPGLEGFPSISDHSMDIYVAKTARMAGV